MDKYGKNVYFSWFSGPWAQHFWCAISGLQKYHDTAPLSPRGHGQAQGGAAGHSDHRQPLLHIPSLNMGCHLEKIAIMPFKPLCYRELVLCWRHKVCCVGVKIFLAFPSQSPEEMVCSLPEGPEKPRFSCRIHEIQSYWEHLVHAPHILQMRTLGCRKVNAWAMGAETREV